MLDSLQQTLRGLGGWGSDPPIMKDREILKEMLANRGVVFDVDALFAWDEKRRALQKEFDDLRARQNEVSGEIQKLKKEGKDAAPILADMQRVAARLKEVKPEQADAEEKCRRLLLELPNVPHESVPIGATPAQNRVERVWGEKPEFKFAPKDHVALGEELGLFDFERAVKISGARFTVYKGAAAKLERSLINFMLDLHTQEHGYEEILPPFMVNAKAMTGTGQLPKFEMDLFKTTSGHYLIPTAEVPLTNLFCDEILNEEDLPISLTAYTPCFRSEAGSYGKDIKGLIRQHQFNKVELVKFAHPSHSYEALEQLTHDAEKVLQKLGLHYRVVTLCTGDMGFSAAKTYDIEVWLPGQNAYREISSCSNCEDFQARRAGIRFRPTAGGGGTKAGASPKGAGKPQHVHTLNGSGLAVGRTLIAILEQCQQEDGSIKIPKALKEYLGLSKITRLK